MDFLFVLSLVIYIALAAFYLMLTLTTYRGRRLHQLADYFLVLYLGISFVETLILLIEQVVGFDFFVPSLRRNLPLYGMLLLTGVLINITIILFKKEGPAWLWLVFAGVWVLGVLILDGGFFELPDILWLTPTRGEHLSFLVLLTGWVGLILILALFVRRLYLAANTAFIKNRARYWAESLAIFFVGALLIFFQLALLGSLFLLVAASAFTYLVRTYRLPDLQILAYQLLSKSLTSMLALLLFAFGFLVSERLLASFPWYRPVLSSAVMAFLLIIFYTPLLEKIQEIVQDIVGNVPDQRLALKEYSKSISNILEVSLLSTVSIGLISEALDVEGGALFLVDEIEDGMGSVIWRLRGVKGMGNTLPGLDNLPEHSSLAHVLAKEQRTLTQTEIDLSPKMQTIPLDVRDWLQSLDVEVFVPVHAQDEWVGLFVLSPKRSGASYTQEELSLLSTFADQTAVALQNARLVESLTRVNNEFRRAYVAMEAAHEKLERIERTKSDFISIASHELRTPLTVISGYAQMLAEAPDLQENAYYTGLTKGMLGGAQRLHEIIESMLDVAKIDASVLDLDPKIISIVSVVDRVVQTLRKDLQEREIALSYEGIEELPDVHGDPQSLEKVFSHLIVNAIKYTPDGGKIIINGRFIPVSAGLLDWDGIEIVVSDTGIGIDPDMQEVIFSRFYQTDEINKHSSGKTKFKGGGPGLGLTVVQGIIEAHSGRVWVSSPGRDEEKCPGSDFHIILPLRQLSFNPNGLEDKY